MGEPGETCSLADLASLLLASGIYPAERGQNVFLPFFKTGTVGWDFANRKGHPTSSFEAAEAGCSLQGEVQGFRTRIYNLTENRRALKVLWGFILSDIRGIHKLISPPEEP